MNTMGTPANEARLSFRSVHTYGTPRRCVGLEEFFGHPSTATVKEAIVVEGSGL